MPTQCRAECPASETASYIIQHCILSHGGRVRRHDTVLNMLEIALHKKGYRVTKEKMFIGNKRRRKPDLVCSEPSGAFIIDAQVVGDNPSTTHW
ncbi:unnamed protein product, partial [Nezara viridula]